MEVAARFLVVDDDPAIARQLARIVRPFGEAIVAGSVSGAKALLASQVAWRGFFVDMGLPDGSGLDVVGAARSAHPTAETMVLTGSLEPRLINAVHDLGAHYVVKPVDGSRIERFCRELEHGAHAEGWADAVHGTDVAAATHESDSLEGCIARLRALLMLRLDPLVRYAIGAVVAQVKADHDLYGSNAVSVVAGVLGEDSPSLYRHAAVAECWTEAEVRALLARRGRDGRALSWSHIVLLGAVEPKQLRENLVEQALDEALSVRQLGSRVQGLHPRE